MSKLLACGMSVGWWICSLGFAGSTPDQRRGRHSGTEQACL